MVYIIEFLTSDARFSCLENHVATGSDSESDMVTGLLAVDVALQRSCVGAASDNDSQ